MTRGSREGDLSRRGFLRVALSAPWLLWLAACRRKNRGQEVTPRVNLIMDKEKIISRIRELNFAPGSELRTTIFPRKIMWETAQVLEAGGQWPGGDQSDWMNNLELMEKQIAGLADMGIKGGRLVVMPFELTEDGKEYRWEPIDKGIELMNKYKMKVDLCVGPYHYPYGPDAARLPGNLKSMLLEEMEQRGATRVEISMGRDRSVPKSSEVIRDWGLDFIKRLVNRYGRVAGVDKISPGNEFPDENKIEDGSGRRIKTARGYMQAVIDIIEQGCDKKVVMNTNIHPADLHKMSVTFEPLLSGLGDRAVLGLDSYKTEELKVPRLARRAERFGQDVAAVRSAFPYASIVFTELQAEPWPDVKTETGAWEEIERLYGERVIEPFFTSMFPSILESHVLPSGITEVGLWGAPLWLVAQDMNNNFPARLIKTVAETMERA